MAKHKGDGVELVCPFCGLQVVAMVSPECAVAHQLPMCKTFNDNDAVDFLTKCRKWYQANPQGVHQ